MRGLTTRPLIPSGVRGGPPAPAAHLNDDGIDPPKPISWSHERVEDLLADDTGGLVIRDTNNLGVGLSAVADELSQYYEIAYAPANPELDGRLRLSASRCHDLVFAFAHAPATSRRRRNPPDLLSARCLS